MFKNVLDTCRECQINLSGVACCSQTVWSKTEPYYVCSTLLKEYSVPLSMCGICYGMSPSTWNNLPLQGAQYLLKKINPLTAGCPVAFFEKVVAYLHARFSYKRGHIPLRKFSWFWNITLRCAQHSFRKRVSCLPCIFDKCSIPFI